MGCYSLAGVAKILGLTPPIAVEASATEPFDETYPKASLVHMDFPEHGGRGPVRLSWYDGGLMPARPAGIRPEDAKRFRRGAEGVMYNGDKGMILAEFNGENARVYPDVKGYVAPPPPENRWDEMHDARMLCCSGSPHAKVDLRRSPALRRRLR